MEIVTVGPGISNRYARFFYASDRKIRNGLVRLGHNVTHISDRDVASSALGLRYLGRELANRKLIEVVEAIQPDLIILFQAHLITSKTLSKIKNSISHCKIANVDNDPMTIKTRVLRLLNLRDIVDATFITSAGEHLEELRTGGLHTSYIPNCTDASMEMGNPYDDTKLSYDLSYFAGDPLWAERWKLPLEVADIAPDIKCGFFGHGKNKIYGRAYFDLLKESKIALNWSGRNDIYLYSSDRISQLFGTGRCVCLYSETGLQKFFSEDEAIFFEDANDLAGKIRLALRDNKWQSIADKGQKRYRNLFNEKRTADYIIDFTFDKDISAYEWSGL